MGTFFNKLHIRIILACDVHCYIKLDYVLVFWNAQGSTFYNTFDHLSFSFCHFSKWEDKTASSSNCKNGVIHLKPRNSTFPPHEQTIRRCEHYNNGSSTATNSYYFPSVGMAFSSLTCRCVQVVLLLKAASWNFNHASFQTATALRAVRWC